MNLSPLLETRDTHLFFPLTRPTWARFVQEKSAGPGMAGVSGEHIYIQTYFELFNWSKCCRIFLVLDKNMP